MSDFNQIFYEGERIRNKKTNKEYDIVDVVCTTDGHVHYHLAWDIWINDLEQNNYELLKEDSLLRC